MVQAGGSYNNQTYSVVFTESRNVGRQLERYAGEQTEDLKGPTSKGLQICLVGYGRSLII